MYVYILSAIMHRKLNPKENIWNENNHSYNSRNKTKVVVESHSSNIIVEKSLHYCSAKLYYDFFTQNVTKILLKRIIVKKKNVLHCTHVL
jgi:predicted ATPase